MANRYIQNILTEYISSQKSLCALNEISSQDAYNKFYSKMFNAQYWVLLMKGVKNMTPFHKRILDLAVSEIKRYDPDFGTKKDIDRVDNYAAKKVARLFSAASTAWNSSTYASQFLVNTVNEDYTVYSDIDDTIEFLNRVPHAKKFSERELSEDGLVVLYEDDLLLATCTTSYSASKKYYGDSRWCTASGVDGVNNGFQMFIQYTSDEEGEVDFLLVQFVDKNNRNESFQMTTDSTSIGAICDFSDERRDIVAIKEHFGENRVNRVLAIISQRYEELVKKTMVSIATEDMHYNFENFKYVAHNAPKLINKIRSKECEQRISYELFSTLGKIENPLEFIQNFETPSFRFNPLRNAYKEDDYLYTFFWGTVNVDFNGDFNNCFFTEEELSVSRRTSNLHILRFRDAYCRLYIIRVDLANRSENPYTVIKSFPNSGIRNNKGRVYAVLLPTAINQQKNMYVNITTGEEIFSTTTGEGSNDLYELNNSTDLSAEFDKENNYYFGTIEDRYYRDGVVKFILTSAGKLERTNIAIHRSDYWGQFSIKKVGHTYNDDEV